jgi:DNA-binding protein YbaB
VRSLAEIEHMISETSARVRDLQEQEFTGSAADGLVAATLSGTQLDIEVHLLAKRRFDREELGAAIVEAVNAAEAARADALTRTALARRVERATDDEFYRQFREAMLKMRTNLPF